ncbi:hypothetical protein B0H19DRAFT_1072555 [Mycena capillaripes]|nr:hypothetical protein B0H19DRAFT_1072555 [Mycena capillaripes]
MVIRLTMQRENSDDGTFKYLQVGSEPNGVTALYQVEHGARRHWEEEKLIIGRWRFRASSTLRPYEAGDIPRQGPSHSQIASKFNVISDILSSCLSIRVRIPVYLHSRLCVPASCHPALYSGARLSWLAAVWLCSARKRTSSRRKEEMWSLTNAVEPSITKPRSEAYVESQEWYVVVSHRPAVPATRKSLESQMKFD